MKENSKAADTNVGNIKEDIIILEQLIIANENCIKNAKNKDNPFVTVWEKQNIAIEHILSDYKRVLKENEHKTEKIENQKSELEILNNKQKDLNKLQNTLSSYKGQFRRQEKENEKINSLIKKCKDIASNNRKEDYLTSFINEYLIYSEHYAEPLELVLNYARSLYNHFYWALDNKHLTMKLPFLSVNHLEHKIEDLYYNNSFGFTINYLKQAIDISYSMQMAQDVRLLKICNFCEKAFIANNPKAEYDTPQCKNKANVYKSRGKIISRNVIHTDRGITVKIPNID